MTEWWVPLPVPCWTLDFEKCLSNSKKELDVVGIKYMKWIFSVLTLMFVLKNEIIELSTYVIKKSRKTQCCKFIAWLKENQFSVFYVKMFVFLRLPKFPIRRSSFKDNTNSACFLGVFFFLGSWLVLLGAVTVKTGRGIFTNVPSQDPKTAVISSIFKVRFLMFVSQIRGYLAEKHTRSHSVLFMFPNSSDVTVKSNKVVITSYIELLEAFSSGCRNSWWEL